MFCCMAAVASFCNSLPCAASVWLFARQYAALVFVPISVLCSSASRVCACVCCFCCVLSRVRYGCKICKLNRNIYPPPSCRPLCTPALCTPPRCFEVWLVHVSRASFFTFFPRTPYAFFGWLCVPEKKDLTIQAVSTPSFFRLLSFPLYPFGALWHSQKKIYTRSQPM